MPENTTNPSAPPPSNSNTYDQWQNEFTTDMSQLMTDVNTMHAMIKAGDPPGDIIIFAMTHLFPDKSKIGQDDMKEQAYAIQDLAGFTNQIAQLQADLQGGNYSGYKADYAKLQSSMKNDPWMQDHTGTITSTDGKTTQSFTFTGLLGNPSDSSSSWSAFQTEMSGLGSLASNPSAFNTAYYNLTGSGTPPTNPISGASGPPPPNPAEAQGYINDFSQMTSQVSSSSSFANNELQYTQQNYQKVIQSMQTCLSSLMKIIEQVNQNTKGSG